MLQAPINRFPWRFDNWGSNPSGTLGTSVTPGASNAEGSWTGLASTSDVAQDVYGLFVFVSNGSTSGSVRQHLLDIGVDAAGGSSYTAVISDIVCGMSAAATTNGYPGLPFFFPIHIKAGSSIACRIQGDNATAGTVRVAIKLYGQPLSLSAYKVGTIAETIGAITNSSGVSVTPGNAADGAWTSLGTTTRDLWWWQLGIQASALSASSRHYYFDLAYGDASNKHSICRVFYAYTSGEVGSLINLPALVECMCEVPAGATLYVRGRCSGAPDAVNVVAIGVG